MTIEDIKNLKDKVYELEGLLELAQLREEKLEELAPLIENRLRDLTKSLTPGDEASEDKKSPKVVTLPLFEADASGRIFAEKYVPEMDSNEDDGFEEEEDDELENEDDELEDKLEDKLAEDELAEVREEYSYKPRQQAKPAFCINDRFRFRRELFGGSDEKFNAAMNKMAMMDNYDEAEEYFIGELGWDPEKEEVVDFLEIIRNYFE